MDPKRFHFRARAMLILMGIVMAAYAWVLFGLQVVNGAYYKEQSTRKIANSEVIQAARGGVLDRYGRVLVSNRATYQVTLDVKLMGDAQTRNETLLNLLNICREQGVSWNDSLPLSEGPAFTFTTAMPFQSVTTAEDGVETTSDTRLYQLLKKLKPTGFPLSPSGGASVNSLATAPQVFQALRSSFQIDPNLNDRDARALMGVLYELRLRSEDIARSSYVFTSDVNISFITVVKERGLPGVKIDTVTVRQYHTDYAAHILGRTGAIQNWDRYKDKGYSLSDTVGLSGVEYAFEDLLRGTPGTKDVELSQSGRVVSESWHIDEETGALLTPSPGDNLMLTLDIDLQEVVERALERYIPGMTEESQVGACVVMDMTGGVLAAASYPTYYLDTYSQDYNDLLSDPLKPMFNRAFQGLYAPGSTFKPLVAAAGLQEGAITTREKILDTGRYTHYDRIEDQPMCWIYRQYRTTHGYENVTEAIRDSCNVYFYETGIRLGIEALDDYATAFGLGEKTGLELYEEKGEVAGPETSAKYGQPWYEGEVMYAAIGQGSTQITPIQLCNYIVTLVNGGTHYAAHLLKTVKSSDFSQVIEECRPQVLGQVEIAPENLEAIKRGMALAANDYFSSLPVKVGAKTGSAQVAGHEEANAVMVVFAPYDDPEIAIATVVEQGGAGARISSIAAEILDYYFSARDVMDAPATENTLIR